MTNGDDTGSQYLSSARSSIDEVANTDAAESIEPPHSSGRSRVAVASSVQAFGGAVVLVAGGIGLGLAASSGRSTKCPRSCAPSTFW